MITKKGFTLFTALISLLLISIALALIFNMVKTEETYIELIQDQSSMSDLMTIADIARADAFNTFIITLRSQWEDYKSNNPMTIRREQMDMNWNEFSQWFVKDNFFERDFAGYFATGILHNLKYSQNPPGYNINTEVNTGTTLVCSPSNCNYGEPNCFCHIEGENSEDNNLFKTVVVDMFVAGGEEVDIIDCDQNSSTCNGSFFLTLDTTQLADENYELLPIVTVVRTKSNQVIQRPVLSRQIYKIYIPWRGLQALRVARNLVLDNETEKSDNPAIYQKHTGMFSPKIHNTLEQARLGYCDPYFCTPRTSFFSTPDSKSFTGEYCHDIPKTLTAEPLPNTLPENFSLSLAEIYDLANSNAIEPPFLELYKQTLLKTLENRADEKISYDTGLVMKGEINSVDANISKITINVDLKRSKSYQTKPTMGGVNNQNLPIKFNNLSDIGTIVGGLGLFLNNNNKSAHIWDVDNVWYNANRDVNAPQDNAQQGAELSCAEIESATTTLEFEETDSRYKIKEEYQSGKTKIIIQITERFHDFYFPPGTPQSWSDLSANNATKYLNNPFPSMSGAHTEYVADYGEQAWTCYSLVDVDEGKACSPKTG